MRCRCLISMQTTIIIDGSSSWIQSHGILSCKSLSSRLRSLSTSTTGTMSKVDWFLCAWHSTSMETMGLSRQNWQQHCLEERVHWMMIWHQVPAITGPQSGTQVQHIGCDLLQSSPATIKSIKTCIRWRRCSISHRRDRHACLLIPMCTLEVLQPNQSGSQMVQRTT